MKGRKKHDISSGKQMRVKDWIVGLSSPIPDVWPNVVKQIGQDNMKTDSSMPETPIRQTNKTVKAHEKWISIVGRPILAGAQLIACLVIVFFIVFLLTKNGNPPVETSTTGSDHETSDITQSTAPSNESTTVTPTTTNPSIPELTEIGLSFSAHDIGISSIDRSECFWSPDANHLVFVGSVKDSLGKYTRNVYMLSVKDGKIIKVADGEYDQNYYLLEPQWASDESMFTVPFYGPSGKFPIYIYNVNLQKLDTLSVQGTCASISPDNSKIVYVADDGTIHLYDFLSESIVDLPGNPKGDSPIWFSDSARILYMKPTGKTEQTDVLFYDFSILDTSKNVQPKSFGFELVLRSIKWVVQDQIVWVNGGSDDGSWYKPFNLSMSQFMITLTEGQRLTFQVLGNSAYYWVYDYPKNGYYLYDSDMTEQGFFTSTPVCLLPDHKLLYVDNNILKIASIDGTQSTALASITDNYHALPSLNGSSEAFIEDEGSSMIIYHVSIPESPVDITRPTANQDGIVYLPLPARQLSRIDLNGDGDPETVQFIYDNQEGGKLMINQEAKADYWGEWVVADWFFLVDLDVTDPYLDIAVQDLGSSNDEFVTFFYYDGKDLVKRGTVAGMLCDCYLENFEEQPFGKGSIGLDGHGGIIAHARGLVIHTWFFDQPWHIGSTGLLEEIPQDYYSMHDAPITLLMDLPLYSDPGAAETSIIAKTGEKGILIKTDMRQWVQIRTQSGKLGWFQLDQSQTGKFRDRILIKSESYEAGAVFDGLSNAD
jgi:hypothetical protein